MTTRHIDLSDDERVWTAVGTVFDGLAYIATLISLRCWSPATDGIWIARPPEPIFYQPPPPPPPEPEDPYVPEARDYWGDELR